MSALIYIGMLAFDLAVVGGAAYLIEAHGWSLWTMVLALILATGSNPKQVLAALEKRKEQS